MRCEGSGIINVMQTLFKIQTRGPALYEFTGQVAEWLKPHADGLLTLMVRHTSASLLIQENADPDVQQDLQAYFSRLVPRSNHPQMSYLTHVQEGPDDMPAHIKAAMMPVSLSIPVAQGRMALGTWQGIYLFEHRDAPHVREVVAHFA
jgi:secondary thiamine-phosphate synthase enzyme